MNKMNPSAKIVWEGMQAGTFIALAPENRATLLTAFPILLDNVINVSSNELCIAAIGYAGSSGPIVVWVNVDGTSGYQKFQFNSYAVCELKSKRRNAVFRFWRGAKRRVARAWDALCGRDS